MEEHYKDTSRRPARHVSALLLADCIHTRTSGGKSKWFLNVCPAGAHRARRRFSRSECPLMSFCTELSLPLQAFRPQAMAFGTEHQELFGLKNGSP